MAEISLFRLHVLRATYLLIGVGLLLFIWPGVVSHGPATPLMNGVVSAMLAAVSLLAALGIRYPLRMLPVLLFEFLWKAVWLIAFAWPLWRAGQLDARTWETVKECLFGVILIPIVVPWDYVLAHYARQPGDPWTRDRAGREPAV